MATGLCSGSSGLALGTGLYAGTPGLWSNGAGLISGFGASGSVAGELLLENGVDAFLLEDGTGVILLEG